MPMHDPPVGEYGPEHHGVADHRGDHDHGEGHRPRLLTLAPHPGKERLVMVCLYI